VHIASVVLNRQQKNEPQATQYLLMWHPKAGVSKHYQKGHKILLNYLEKEKIERKKEERH